MRRVLLVCWVMRGVDTLVSWKHRLDYNDYEIGGWKFVVRGGWIRLYW